MSDSKDTATVEIASEPIIEAEIVKTEESVPTRIELKEKGWSKAEMDAAEKRGMIGKPEEKKTEPKKVEEVKPDLKKVDEEKPKSNFLDEMDRELTPEQEKVFLETFPPGTKPRAFYFRAKNERLARQNAEAERDKLALELQMHKDSKLKLEDRPEVDENGNVIDPEDQPLTMKQLKAMQLKEREEMDKQREELSTRSAKASDALKTQEEFARSTLPDFDETVKLAAELVQNLDMIPEKWKREKVVKLIKELQVTAATADKYGVDDYNAPMVSFEIGQLHPKYGQKADPNGETKVDPKPNGKALTAEQMKRMEENTQRRTSSASLPGSSNGRRVVSVDDLTIKDVLKMTPEERFKFKKDHPEKMQKLMRG
jgi:transcription-repair coupling factor (superfamily II helicase)